MKRLSINFTLEEFTRSQTATRFEIDNTPGEKEIQELQNLVDNVLQPLRNALGSSIHITSGYRCKELNTKIGGSSTSQHMKGQAVDIVTGVWTPKQVFNYIADYLEFDQLIYEFGSWVHVSFNEGNNRKQKLEAYKSKGKTRYKKIERA